MATATPRALGSVPADPAFVADPHPCRPRFGASAGIHYCLGAPLARMELQIAFTSPLRRVPGIALVEEPTWKPTYVLRGLEALRVRA